MEFLAIGDVTTDAFIALESSARVWNDGGVEKLCIRFGDKIPYESATIVHGVGNAANAAVAAARLGVKSALLTFVGDDLRGKAAKEAWQADGVDLSLVQTSDLFPTHYHFVLRYGAERTILVKHEKWPYSAALLPQEPPVWLYLTSIGEHTEAFHYDILAYLKKHPSVKLAFQPGTFQIKLLAHGALAEIFPHTELFFCNKEEAQYILQQADDDPIVLARAFLDKGVANAVVTDGPRGAFACSSEGCSHVPMYPDPNPPVDRTGAGDAFSATVVAYRIKGKPLAEALLRGPINSMSVVQHIGAQEGLLSTAALEELLQSAPTDYTIQTIL